MSTLLAQSQVETAILLSFIKPLIMLAVFGSWAWLVATVLDKDAKFYYLNPRMWNGIQMGCGGLALIIWLAIPWQYWFWVGLPVAVIILGTPVLLYWQYRNKEVPEAQRFTLSGEGFQEKLSAGKARKAAKEAAIRFIGSDGLDVQVPSKEDPLFEVQLAAEDIIGPALSSRASRAEVSVAATGTNLSHTVDGIKYKRTAMAPELATRTIDFLKQIAGLDTEDRRRRQTGDFMLSGPTGNVTTTITTAGSSTGLVLRLDFDRAERLIKPFDALGLLPSQLEGLRTLEQGHERHGVVLLGAPSGSGLTTSGYSFVARHDPYTCNVKTLELEQEALLDGVDQVIWDASNPDIDYATNLQSILRRDPDVVLATGVRDSESAKVAVSPGMTGPLTYITMRVGSVAEQVRDWVKLVGDVETATSSLRTIVNQRLIRTLCPNCRQAFQPSADQLKRLQLPADQTKQLYRAGGKVQVKNKIETCSVCGGTGYLGQIGIFEVMNVDPDCRKSLVAGDLKGALTHARRNKMVFLQEAALRKVQTGETSIEEVIRVTSPEKSAEHGPQSKPAA